VGFIGIAKEYTLTRHYLMMARLRIRLSDRRRGISGDWYRQCRSVRDRYYYHDAGLATRCGAYLFRHDLLWMFVMSLDDGPTLTDQYSKLKDIGERVNTGEV
jgi:hypothetical protein